MKIERITAVYFSPTGGTKRYVCGLAKRLDAKYGEIDLTDFYVRARPVAFGSTELVIFGAPVYSGRLPEVENGIFERLTGSGTPAIFMVSYGNRACDDALLELKNLCEKQGFTGIAAGTFIAPHTYSQKAGAGRPNEADESCLDTFAAHIGALLKEAAPGAEPKLRVPGNEPYREIKSFPFTPKADGKCTKCGACVSICPVQAIGANNPKRTDKTKCIDCFACVKKCPQHARNIKAFPFRFAVKKLEKALLAQERQSELFF